jgi:superfamily II DNA or RNA helicase
VFDLCVNDNHNFFANGILVHNSHHCQSPTAEKVLRGCSAYFRLAASDSIKEGDPDKFNRISGLCGPVLCQVTSSALIEQSRSAAPHLYLVDIPTWQRKFAGVDHEPQPNSVAWTLVNDEWTKALYLGPVYQLERNGEVKMKKQRRLEGDRWKIEMVPMTVPTFHRLLLNGVETQVLARDTLLDRRYDRAIIRFKERNDLICDWTEHYVRHDWNTVVVATRTPHVVILEALLSARIPGRVRALTGEASTPLRNEMFSWFKRTKGAVLVTPLIKEGVSINEIRAGVVADVVADWEVAKQIIGRFMRKKQVANECHITWFIDRQHPRYFKNVADMMEKLGHIEGFTFHHPVAGPDTINQALIHKGQI